LALFADNTLHLSGAAALLAAEPGQARACLHPQRKRRGCTWSTPRAADNRMLAGDGHRRRPMEAWNASAPGSALTSRCSPVPMPPAVQAAVQSVLPADSNT
jgi:hypothetical protein